MRFTCLLMVRTDVFQEVKWLRNYMPMHYIRRKPVSMQILLQLLLSCASSYEKDDE